MSSNSFQVQSSFDDDKVRNLLCCAFEGGSNYWYVIVKYEYPEGREAVDYAEGGGAQDPKMYWHRAELLPTHEGGAVIIRSVDNDEINGAKQWRLDWAALKRGLDVMSTKYPRHFANFVADNEDADTGDVFLQCCLFGEVVFA